MKTLYVLVATIGVGVGITIGRDHAAYRALQPERTVAALPGVGQSWIDTLRIAADGDSVTIEPVNPAMIEAYGPFLLGLYEPLHRHVALRLDMAAYTAFLRGQCGAGDRDWSYRHPPELTSPAGVLAHEFGHHLLGFSEERADKFGLALLSIRGWASLDTTDRELVKIHHAARFALIRSRWPK